MCAEQGEKRDKCIVVKANHLGGKLLEVTEDTMLGMHWPLFLSGKVLMKEEKDLVIFCCRG